MAIVSLSITGLASVAYAADPDPNQGSDSTPSDQQVAQMLKDAVEGQSDDGTGGAGTDGTGGGGRLGSPGRPDMRGVGR